MKVVLNQDVKTLGKKGDIVDVSDGYARNFLLPKNLATPATATAINAIKIKNEAIEHHRIEQKNEAIVLAKKLNQMTVTVKIKVGANGKIYGSLSNVNISDALNEMGVEIDRKKIVLSEPIKTAGRYEVAIKLYPDVSAKLAVNVIAEQA